jgi:hypothetical protein
VGEPQCPATLPCLWLDARQASVYALQRPRDVDDAPIEIHVLPAQPEHFSLTQSQPDGHRHHRSEPVAVHRRAEAGELLFGEGLRFKVWYSRRGYPLRDVVRDLTCAHRVLQCFAQHRMVIAH